MRVGITGTRESATEYQLRKIRGVLQELKGTEFHHGDSKLALACEGTRYVHIVSKMTGCKIM